MRRGVMGGVGTARRSYSDRKPERGDGASAARSVVVVDWQEERSMNGARRRVLRNGSGLAALGLLFAAGVLKAQDVLAANWYKAAFESKSIDETLKALGGGKTASSSDIAMTVPDIAEN